MAIGSDPVIQAIVSISLLLLGAKLLGELFDRLHLPTVLGELGAGVILGPLYFGGLVQIPPGIVEVNDVVLAFGQVGGIVLLFIAGLEMPFRDFVRGGVASFTTGALGVVLPFAGGFLLFAALRFDFRSGLIIGAALTATSIAISVQTLREVGRLNSPEGKLVIGAAVVDDVLAIAVLSIVVSLVTGAVSSLLDVIVVVGTVLFLFAFLLGLAVLVSPRLTQAKIWRTKGSVETVATAFLFGLAALAGIIGLSPVVGAFAAGMGVAGANIASRMREYVEKLELIFRPLFFAVVGSQVSLSGFTPLGVLTGVAVIGVAMVTKLIGCGLPALYFLKNNAAARTVGIAMMSRGEVGLIIAGLAVTSRLVSAEIHAIVVLMVVVTTVITPVWLKREVSTAAR